ncbi:conserved hypothetical protein [Candidatus Brocadia pituitae]|nr:conserved hypothetical protein [Candidatus Brocadia pituitae]
MKVCRKFCKKYHFVWIFALSAIFYLPQNTSSVYAKCTKENDCFSCHSSQELRDVHKTCQYLNQGCLSCHAVPKNLATSSPDSSCSGKGEKGSGGDRKGCQGSCEGEKGCSGGGNGVSSDVQMGREDWEKLQRCVHETIEKCRVGRKFLETYGPLGVGSQCVPVDTFGIPSWATVDMMGESDNAIHALKREIAHIPLIYKDFWLFWRDIEASSKCETPLDTSAAIGAAVAAAAREDDLVFNGLPDMHIAGLLNVDGRNIAKLSDWSVIGNGFQDVVSAIERLRSTGFLPPYTLVVSPRLYALLHKVYERTGKLEIEAVKEMVKGGVYQSSVLKKDVALVMAAGRQNADLAVGGNFKVEYCGPENLNHRFRVVGSSVLRIKCPQAICTIE